MKIKEQYQPAYNMYLEKLKQEPRNVFCMVKLAQIYVEHEMKEEAKKQMLQAIELLEQNPNLVNEINEPDFKPEEVYFCMITANGLSGNLKEVLEWCHKLMQKYPHSELTYKIIQDAAHNFSAIRHYDAALELYLAYNNIKQDHNSLYDIGFAYDRLYDYENALKYFLLCVEQTPTDEAHRKILSERSAELAEKYIFLKKYSEGYDTVMKAIEMDKENVDAICVLAMYYKNIPEKDLHLAEQLYLQALEKNPKCYSALHNLATIYQWEKGDYRTAVKYYEQCIEIKTLYKTLCQMILIYADLKDEENAVKYINRVLKEYPKEASKDKMFSNYFKKKSE